MQGISASCMFNSFFLPNNIVSRNDKVGFHDVSITQLPLCGRRSITTIPALHRQHNTIYNHSPFTSAGFHGQSRLVLLHSLIILALIK